MERLFKEFDMTYIATYNLSKKKSRTATDFPFSKLGGGAMKIAGRGFTRTAFQNVKNILGRKLYTKAATTWNDKKEVGL